MGKGKVGRKREGEGEGLRTRRSESRMRRGVPYILSSLPCRALMAKLLAPLQVKVEEWKRTTSALEREHDKGKLFSNHPLFCLLLHRNC